MTIAEYLNLKLKETVLNKQRRKRNRTTIVRLKNESAYQINLYFNGM